MYVKEMNDGDVIQEYCKIYDVLYKQKKDGSPYVAIRLGDKTGHLMWNVWDGLEAFNKYNVKTGDTVYIEGLIDSYMSTKQIQPSIIRLLTEEESVDGSKFHESLPQEELDQYVIRFKAIIEMLSEDWREAVLSIFNLPQIKDNFLKSPASIKFHENFYGGLLVHTVNITEECISKGIRNKYVNNDLLIAMALFHDIGKIFAYNLESFSHSDEGRLKGHIFLGAAFLEEHLKVTDKFSKINKDLVISGVLSSHNKPEYGAFLSTATIEAYILSSEDEIETNIQYWKGSILDKQTQDNFVYNKYFNRFVYREDKHLV